MNTKVLLLGAVVAAFTATTFAAEPLLTPRAASTQITSVAGVTETPVAAVAASTLLSPRATGNQFNMVKGGNDALNPALGCQKGMNTSPKAAGECASHATMPGCTSMAMCQ